MPHNTKEPSHAKILPHQSQQWLLTMKHINILKIKEMCENVAANEENHVQSEPYSMYT